MDDVTQRSAQADRLPVRGRGDALAALDAAITGVGEGRPGVVLIEGSAGYGKSRLLAEAADRAQLAGVGVVLGCADPDDRDSPFVPLLAALGQGESPVLSLDELRVLHELRAERYWFVVELGAALERAALDRPLLVGLDDLQWADASTLDAVRTLSGGLGSAAVLWVLTFRPRHDSLALGRMIVELEDAKTTRHRVGHARAGGGARGDRRPSPCRPRRSVKPTRASPNTRNNPPTRKARTGARVTAPMRTSPHPDVSHGGRDDVHQHVVGVGTRRQG